MIETSLSVAKNPRQEIQWSRIHGHSRPLREDNKSQHDNFWIELEPWSVLSQGLQTQKLGLLPLSHIKDRLRGSRVTLESLEIKK